jgi:hypothetical protein
MNNSKLGLLAAYCGHSPLHSKWRRCVGLLAVLVLCAAPARAGIVLDQVGTSATFAATGASYTTLNDAQFQSAPLDDFTVTADQLSLTWVEGVMRNLSVSGSPLDFSTLTSFQVAIFTSPSVVSPSFTGDAGNQVIARSSATLTADYASISGAYLVSIPVSIVLPSAGAYYISVMGQRSTPSDGSSLTILGTNAFSGGFPFGNNAQRVQSGGTNSALNTNLAYRITTEDPPPVPEPSSIILVGIGLAGLIVARCRGRRAV